MLYRSVAKEPSNGRLTYLGRDSMLVKRMKTYKESYEVAKSQEQQSYYWDSTEYNSGNAWYVGFSSGTTNNGLKYTSYYVRPVAAHDDFEEFMMTFFNAFEQCRKGKMTTKQCSRYMGIADADLPVLAKEVHDMTYRPSTSTCFLVRYPKWREVFSANFRDRIVHHWACQFLEPLFEDRFKAQGDVSFNCRKGYGVKKAVERIQDGMKYVSSNYTKEAWVWKGDLVSCFMSIDKDVMWRLLEKFINRTLGRKDITKKYPVLEQLGWKHEYLHILLNATKIIVYHEPANDCIFNTDTKLWVNLAAIKSLLRVPPKKGMAIGNLPTQLFVNFMLSFFDSYVLFLFREKKFFYVRFVDDMTIGCDDKEFLSKAILKLERYLNVVLKLSLHHDKQYFQPVSHGISMIGSTIKNHRVYLSNRTYARFEERVHGFSKQLKEKKEMTTADCFRIQSVVNSYLGFMKDRSSYNKRKRILRMFPSEFYKYFYIEGPFSCIKTKREYKPLAI